MRRVAAGAVTPLVRFVEWLFGPRLPFLDVGLGLMAASWGALMVFRPRLFDSGVLAGMQWLPDLYWIVFFGLLGAMHGVGAARPPLRGLRTGALLLSSWIWLSVAASLYRVEMTTGVLSYAILGFGALCGSIFISGLPRDGG